MTLVPALTVLIYAKDGQPIAHCLEMDFVTTGGSLERALEDLLGVLEERLQDAVERDRVPRLLKPAPQHYWERLVGARLVGHRTLRLQDPKVAAAFRTGEIPVREFACAA
jgi:hypothetical protein